MRAQNKTVRTQISYQDSRGAEKGGLSHIIYSEDAQHRVNEIRHITGKYSIDSTVGFPEMEEACCKEKPR